MTNDSVNIGILPHTFAGDWNMPIVRTDAVPLTDGLIPFNMAKTCIRRNVGVHFFIDDYQFERVWRSPQRYVDMLGKYRFACAPDFSLCLEMPLAVKLWNVYRSRLITNYWQSKGLKIVPVLQWAERRTFDFCFAGIMPGGTVAVSTLGAAKHLKSRIVWKQGMKEAIRQLHPDTILLYGTPIDFDFGGIQVVYYKNEVLERRKKYGR